MPTWWSSQIYRHQITTGQMQASVTSLMAVGPRILKQFHPILKHFDVDCHKSERKQRLLNAIRTFLMLLIQLIRNDYEV